MIIYSLPYIVTKNACATERRIPYSQRKEDHVSSFKSENSSTNKLKNFLVLPTILSLVLSKSEKRKTLNTLKRKIKIKL